MNIRDRSLPVIRDHHESNWAIVALHLLDQPTDEPIRLPDPTSNRF